MSRRRRHDWGPLVGDLAARQASARSGWAAPNCVERQHSLGKLTVRERLDLLLDPGTWVEYGLLADHMDAGLGDRYLAADGAVTGIGEIDGRPVAVAAYDFTVMAGSMGGVGENKIARMRAHAVRQRIPFVWLLDSAGARIQSTSGSTFAGAGALFREQVAMSGVVPMVAAMLGHCAAGTAYIPGARRLRADGEGHVVDGARRPPPREGRGRRGRHRGGDGRLRGAHQDLAVSPISRSPTTRECLADRAQVPVVLPAAQRRTPAGHARPTIPSTGASRSSTTSCRPRPGARTTCARSCTAIVDDGDVFWMKPEWAKNLVTGLARVGGQPVGIVANQPMVLGGALDVNAADKAARFVWLCDAFNIPLVFLHDVPGFIVGSRGREAGHHPPRRQDAVRGERGDGARRSA